MPNTCFPFGGLEFWCMLGRECLHDHASKDLGCGVSGGLSWAETLYTFCCIFFAGGRMWPFMGGQEHKEAYGFFQTLSCIFFFYPAVSWLCHCNTTKCSVLLSYRESLNMELIFHSDTKWLYLLKYFHYGIIRLLGVIGFYSEDYWVTNMCPAMHIVTRIKKGVAVLELTVCWKKEVIVVYVIKYILLREKN